MVVKIASVVASLLFTVTLAYSQSDSAQISGTVTDHQGLAVAQAKVEIVNQDGLVKREAQTDETGHYSVSLLHAGRYQVVVQVQGFNASTSKDISLTAGQKYRRTCWKERTTSLRRTYGRQCSKKGSTTNT